MTNKVHHTSNNSEVIEARYIFWFIVSSIQQNIMEAFDFAGCTKLPRGPYTAGGPRIGKPQYTVCNRYWIRMETLEGTVPLSIKKMQAF